MKLTTKKHLIYLLILVFISPLSVAESVLPPIALEGEHVKNYPEMSTDLLDALQDYRITSPAEFSPDGKFIVAGASDDTIKLWDIKSRKLIYSFYAHDNDVSLVKFSPNGKRLVSADEQGVLKLWDFKSRKLLTAFKGNVSNIRRISFSYDGSLLVTSSYFGSVVKLWNVGSGGLVREFKGYHLAQFNPVNNIMLLVSYSGIMFWDAENNKKHYQIDDMDESVDPYFSKNGKYVYILSSSGISVWDFERRVMGFEIISDDYDNLEFSGFSKDENIMYLSGMHYNYSNTVSAVSEIFKFDAKERSLTLIFKKYWNNHGISAISFHSESNMLALWEYMKSVEIINIEKNTILHKFSGHDMSSDSAIISPDGETLVTFSNKGDAGLRVWDLNNKLLIHDFNIKTISRPVYNNSGSRLAVDTINGIYVWDTDSLRLLNRLKLPEKDYLSQSLIKIMRFSPDGNKLATSARDKKAVDLWDIKTGSFIKNIGNCSPESVVFSPDSKTLGVACYDQPINFWNIEDKKLSFSLGHNAGGKYDLTYSSNGKIIASVVDHNAYRVGDSTFYSSRVSPFFVKVWDADTHQELHTFKGRHTVGTGTTRAFYAMTFTQNENLIISNGSQLNVWNTKSGKLVQTIETDSPDVRSASFSSGTNQLAIGFKDKIEVWDMLGNEPSLRLFHGQDGNWLLWNNEGQFWRGDDGTLLLQKDFSPLPQH